MPTCVSKYFILFSQLPVHLFNQRLGVHYKFHVVRMNTSMNHYSVFPIELTNFFMKSDRWPIKQTTLFIAAVLGSLVKIWKWSKYPLYSDDCFEYQVYIGEISAFIHESLKSMWSLRYFLEIIPCPCIESDNSSNKVILLFLNQT